MFPALTLMLGGIFFLIRGGYFSSQLEDEWWSIPYTILGTAQVVAAGVLVYN